MAKASEVLADHGQGGGKGAALWKSLYLSSGDIICWCDADIRNYDNRFILGPLGPLLMDSSIGFIKGFYQRPLREDGEGGGRVTELMARPLVASLFPHLNGLTQPLSGEYAGRTSLLRQLPFASGYGVDLALLVDLTQRFGVGVLAQVDLGARVHRNRPLTDLGPQATAILATALRRAGLQPVPESVALHRPDVETVSITTQELPPLSVLEDAAPRPSGSVEVN